LALEGSKVRWDSFPVIEEFASEEPVFGTSYRPRLVANDKSFGHSYFITQEIT
jgi:hypothetical protein